jgi:hypothetical protein
MDAALGKRCRSLDNVALRESRLDDPFSVPAATPQLLVMRRQLTKKFIEFDSLFSSLLEDRRWRPRI